MNTLVIEKQKMRHNLKMARQRAKGALIYGVLKGDAYGLGLIETANLMRDEGVTRFAVGQPSEGAMLRRAGFQHEEILLLRSTADPDEVDALLDAGLVATIGSRDAALALSGLAERRGTVAEAHLKIDTGLGRYGFLPSEFDKIQSVFRYISSLAISGVYTHINPYVGASAARLQMEQFRALLTQMQLHGLEPGVIHAAGSSALFRFDLPRLDAVRIGQAMTGILPSKGHGLQPVGFVECPISEMRWLPKGYKTGSIEPYTCRRPTRIALLPVGLADGIQVGRIKRGGLFGLTFGNRSGAQVWLGSEKVCALGNVGLNHTIVDVTDLTCSIGDIAHIEADPLFCTRLSRQYI